MTSSSLNQGNGQTSPRGELATLSKFPLAPRRVVLLADGEASAAQQVLREYQGADMSGTRVHQDIQRCAAEHRGQWVAVEWLGKLGWIRYLWCRKT